MSKVFGLAAGVDFPAALVAGLRARLAGQPPEAMAGVTLYLNTQRMRRRVIEIFTNGDAAYLPRLRLVTYLGQDVLMAGVPAAVSGLRRRCGRILMPRFPPSPRCALWGQPVG